MNFNKWSNKIILANVYLFFNIQTYRYIVQTYIVLVNTIWRGKYNI